MTEFSFFPTTEGLSVADIANLTGAKPVAGAELDRRVTGIAPIDSAEPSDLSFVNDTKFTSALASTKAGVVLTSERFAAQAPGHAAVLCVAKPYDAFVAVARHLYRPALRPTSAFSSGRSPPTPYCEER